MFLDCCCSVTNSVQFSCSVVSDSLQPHGLQHARPPCPSPAPGVYSNSCPLSQWCYATTSSSVTPFSSCLSNFTQIRVFSNKLSLHIRWPKYWSFSISPSIISVHFQGKPLNITVIQIYALTSNTEEAEVERFYEGLQDFLELIPKKDIHFIIGDWNAKVGHQETPGVTGKFGFGVQNEAGQRLIEFCQENALVIANTLFQQHKRRLYIWTSPDGRHRNQIDDILCSHRWRNSIQSAKTKLGAHCGSDHELLIAKFRLN